MELKARRRAFARSLGALVALCSAGLFAGCSEPSRPLDPEPDVLLEATTEDVYALGGAEAVGWQQFEYISDAAFDAAANLALVDRSSEQPRIVVVDAGGGLLRSISRPGGGPGELRYPQSVEFLGDGRLVVADLGHQALFLYDQDGAFSGEFARLGGPAATTQRQMSGRPGFVRAVGLPTLSGVLSDDRLLALRASSRTLEAIAQGGQSTEFFRALALPPAATGGAKSGLALGVGQARVELGGLMPSRRAFAPPLGAAILADGSVAVIDSVGYQVKIVGSDGTPLSVLKRSIEPFPVTEEMREAAARGQQLLPRTGVHVQSRGANISSRSADAVADLVAQVLAEEMTFGSEVPVLKKIAVDSEDRIWVSRTGDDGSSVGAIDLLTVKDGYVGTLAAKNVQMPWAFGPAGLMAYIDQDELGVPVVRVVRLQSLNRAAADA